ncbi:hypothetical protein Peur_029961 [Populus x canadensis]
MDTNIMAEQDEEKVPEFKQSMIAFLTVRIDLGSHNVASPLLDGECIDVHPFIEGLAVCLFDLNSKIEWSIEDLKCIVHGLDEAMRGLPLDDDFTISYTSLLDEKSNTFCLIFTFARR